MTTVLKRLSPAKVNLFLNIVDQIDNGYHIIESFFVKLKLSDSIIIERSNVLQCEVVGRDDIGGENIVLRVAKTLQAIFDVKEGVKIIIEKNIPIGAGLGGGSSNAATVMLMLKEFWHLDASVDDLFKIAMMIGADVPFFLQSHHAAYVTGIGDIIAPKKLGIQLYILLIYPNYQSTTRDVYRGFEFQVRHKKAAQQGTGQYILENIYHGKNDLESVALNLYPFIAKIKEFLLIQQEVLFVRMSGSGSVFFACFDNLEACVKAKSNVIGEHCHDWHVWSETLDI